MNSFPRLRSVAIALTLVCAPRAAIAQTNDDKGGVTVRQVSVSTGYAAVQLPPITLGGYLPIDILNADLITSAAGEIEWRRVTPHTTYGAALFGGYTGRTRYSRLNAPNADLTFGVSHVPGTRWRLGAGVANTITSSDQLAAQPTRPRQLVDGAASFDDLAGTVALARSPSPDLAQAALFVPITQSLAGADAYGTTLMASNVRADVIYLNSLRLATHFRGAYTAVQQLSTNNDAASALSFPDSKTARAGVGVTYDRSERTQVTADVDWSQTAGASEDKALLVTLGYGWMGRKWFTAVTAGAALHPFRTSAAGGTSETTSRTPTLIATAAVGYKFSTQTLLVEYSRAPHDEYGNGGRNTATGFQGSVQSFVGAWVWSVPGSRWTVRSDFTMVQRPGNFSYINAWFATAGLGRQIGTNVRLSGELLFDRHGSRGFEGFHLTREGVRLNLVWTPSRRRVVSSDSEQ